MSRERGTKRETWYAQIRRTKQGYRAALESFDRDVKRRFKGGSQEEYLISFPMANLEDDEDGGLQANCWRIKGYVRKFALILELMCSHAPWESMNVFSDLNDRNELMTIFEPLVIDILRLIDDQVKSSNLRRGKDGVRVARPSSISSPSPGKFADLYFRALRAFSWWGDLAAVNFSSPESRHGSRESKSFSQRMPGPQ